MALIDTINSLYKQGLGELLTLHTKNDKIYLGKMVYEKERLVIKDQGYLSSLKSTELLQCWENGIIGAVSHYKNQEWQSLSFCGLEQCKVAQEDLLSKTGHGGLVVAENEYGEQLIDFFGSVYRGYKMMLDNHFLPVILMKEIALKQGGFGLAVANLRAAPMAISIINDVHNVVMESVEKHLVLGVDDVEVESDQFNELFGAYLPKG